MTDLSIKNEKKSLLRQLSPAFCGLIPLLLTAFVFSGTLNDAFTNWDDDDYVVNNPLIRHLSPRSINRIFSPKSLVSGNYQPATILSLAVNYTVGGLNPRGYILTDIFLHLLNVLLVFLLLRTLTGNYRIAGICATLFGIHPLHVESVAWIAARKDVLYTFFFLSSLLWYLRYREKNGTGAGAAYGLAFVLFIIALLAKSAAVTLPAVLLLIDLYQRRKFTSLLVVEKIPFFAAAILFGALAIIDQQSQGTLREGSAYSLAGRILIACYSFMFYIVRFFIPMHLSSFYPYPPPLPFALWSLAYKLSPLGVIGSAGGAWYFRKNRVFLFGFLFFSIAVLFLVHVVPVGATITADRFTYLPYLGLSFIIASAVESVMTGVRSQGALEGILVTTVILALATLGMAAYQRCKVWNNSITLWSDVLDKYPRNPYSAFIGNEYCGSALMQAGRTGEALTHLRMAAAINPVDPKARYNLGNALMQVQKTTEAVVEYRMATELDSGYALAHHNLAVALRQLGRSDEAVAEFRKALGIDPLDPLAHSNLADALMQLGRTEEAIAEYRKALDLDPGNFNLYCNLGMAFMQEHNAAETADCFQQALNVAPADLGVLSNLCATFMKIGRPDLAVTTAEQAMALARSMGDEALAREIERTVETIRRTGSPAAN
jgi:Flp pilus assembly protein TadD